MRPKIFRAVTVTSAPIGASRSIPAEVGLASPLWPVQPARPLEHPQVLSTAVDVEFLPTEPTNDASLALGCPRAPQSQDSEG